MKNLIKKKWFKIVLIILGVLIIAGLVLFFVFGKNKNKQEETFTYTRTVTLNYTSLEETVVASGTIESQNTSTITSSISDASVSKIYYSVGDYVEEGDVIIELDTSNLNKKITKASESVTKQKEKLQDTYDDAYDNYDDIEDSYNSAKSTMYSAEAAFNAAKDSCKNAQSEYDTAKKDFDDYVKQFDTSTGNIEEDATYITKKNTLTLKETNLKALKTSTNYDSLEKAYNEACSTYTNLKSSLSKAEDTLDNAQDNLDDGVDTDQLDELYDTVADYKLKAKSSGQITSINAVVGSNTNGTLATIQDTSKLKISVTIDEYDILQLELGMKAKIETDASDTIYDGVVSQISPTASGNFGSTGFEVEINVTSTDIEDLKIGMSAEVTIIISSTDESFNVPVDAVEEKEDGTKVIYVENESGEFEEVEVTTGDSNGYYIEIFSNELSVGDKVRASANEDEANVNITEDEMSEDMSQGFNFPGGGGGDMPSGGGSMPSGGGGGMPSGGGGGGMPGGF